jgi:hypothetical protein
MLQVEGIFHAGHPSSSSASGINSGPSGCKQQLQGSKRPSHSRSSHASAATPIRAGASPAAAQLNPTTTPQCLTALGLHTGLPFPGQLLLELLLQLTQLLLLLRCQVSAHAHL